VSKKIILEAQKLKIPLKDYLKMLDNEPQDVNIVHFENKN
jgi:hypothetical protein